MQKRGLSAAKDKGSSGETKNMGGNKREMAVKKQMSPKQNEVGVGIEFICTHVK